MSYARSRSERPALFLVPQPAPETSAPSVSFCSHCGARPQAAEVQVPPSRVCAGCGFGLVLQAAADVAPGPGDAFVVVDSSMSVCAMSAAAEHLLGAHETDAVHRLLTELFVPADAEAQGRQNLAVAVTHAARGDGTARSVTVRPANTFGVRISARIAGCGPPSAALLVLE